MHPALVAIAAGGLVAGCHQLDDRRAADQNAGGNHAETARLAEHADFDNAETLVKVRLKEAGTTATFIREKLVHVGRQVVVCGFVNAKNGSARAPRYEHFAVAGTTVMLGSDGQQALRRIERLCGA